MSKKQVLTTFEAAALCNVSYNTIKNWIKRGLLKAYRTAGGHLRVEIEDLESFSRQYGIPIYEKDDPGRRRILILDNDESVGAALFDIFSQNRDALDIVTTGDSFEAGVLIESTRPDLVILNPMMPGISGTKACRLIRKSAANKHAKIAIITTSSMDVTRGYLDDLGADMDIAKPVDRVKLLEKVEPVIMPKGGVRSHKHRKGKV